ncbi:MAG: hypothetical protein PHV59_12075, partial [Victivallales bacterium]|nr:hypothetical protein [Victivallales bacterium]
ITCNLRVSDKGYVAITGNGCNWANLNRPDDYKPTSRPTITPGAGSSSAAASGNATCFPYTCPGGNGKFSVMNNQLYNSEKCQFGTQVNSYEKICGNKTGTNACEFVGGICALRNGSGPEQPNCQGPNDKFTHRGYSQWGPDNRQQVNINLCGSDNVCCEPNNNGQGFLPGKQTPINNQQPVGGNQTAVGNDGACYFDYPQNIYANTPFSVTAKYVKRNLTVGSVALNFINAGNGSNPPPNGNGNFSKKRVLNNNQNTWEESDWTFDNNKLPEGKYTLKFTHSAEDAGGPTACDFTPQITVQSAQAVQAANPGAPKCSDTIVAANIPSACSNCIKGKIETGGTKLSSITDCNNDDQRINIYCKNHTAICGNYIAACSSCNGTAVGLYLQNFQSASNQVFGQVVAEISAGHANALTGSIFVTAANRAPGLQHQFCDPGLNTAPGGCTFGVPDNSQLGT